MKKYCYIDVCKSRVSDSSVFFVEGEDVEGVVRDVLKNEYLFNDWEIDEELKEWKELKEWEKRHDVFGRDVEDSEFSMMCFEVK